VIAPRWRVALPTDPAQRMSVRESPVGLSEIDRQLLKRCLERKPGAWEDFVDRFLGLVVHVIHHTMRSRSVAATATDIDDLTGDVFLAVLQDDFATLRHFRGESSLATYLTVVARRVVVRELLRRHPMTPLDPTHETRDAWGKSNPEVERLSNRDEIERLLAGLPAPEADVVRLYHLEGKSYREISSQVGMPENSIGPLLSRAREKMRRAAGIGE
jgi:RNA polymerase sigma-70 factor (ECF subfamily)